MNSATNWTGKMVVVEGSRTRSKVLEDKGRWLLVRDNGQGTGLVWEVPRSMAQLAE